MIPPILQQKMAVTTSSINGFLADSPTPILTNIGIDTTRESLIELNRLISGNAAYVALNLRGGLHGHFALTIT